VVGAPILTTLPRTAARGPVIPFIGLAEGVVLTAMRRSGVPLQRIRPALEQLDAQFGLAHALASRRLYTDGAEILFDYAEATADPGLVRAAAELVVVRNGQRVFNEIVAAYRPDVGGHPGGHPAGLPELFLDRSLGRRQVPDLLRAAGLRLRTLAEVYGIRQLPASARRAMPWSGRLCGCPGSRPVAGRPGNPAP
jgi:hypothetical protein